MGLNGQQMSVDRSEEALHQIYTNVFEIKCQTSHEKCLRQKWDRAPFTQFNFERPIKLSNVWIWRQNVFHDENSHMGYKVSSQQLRETQKATRSYPFITDLSPSFNLCSLSKTLNYIPISVSLCFEHRLLAGRVELKLILQRSFLLALQSQQD